MRCVSVPSFSVALARPIILKRVFKDLSLDLTSTPTWHRENWCVRSGCIHAGFPTVAAVYDRRFSLQHAIKPAVIDRRYSFPAGMSFTSTVALSDSETWTGFPSGSNCCMTFESKKAFSSKASHPKTL